MRRREAEPEAEWEEEWEEEELEAETEPAAAAEELEAEEAAEELADFASVVIFLGRPRLGIPYSGARRLRVGGEEGVGGGRTREYVGERGRGEGGGERGGGEGGWAKISQNIQANTPDFEILGDRSWKLDRVVSLQYPGTGITRVQWYRVPAARY